MVLRSITKRRRLHTFLQVSKIVYVCFFLAAFCGSGSSGYAQFNFLKGNNAQPTANRPATSGHQATQNHAVAQNKQVVQQKQNAQKTQSGKKTQKSEMQALPQGNRNDQLLDATNNPSAMKTALQTIPWNRLPNPAREKVQAVLSNKPLYRRLPQQSAYCEPIMYDFLLNHPDVVVAIWEKLGVTQISLTEHGRAGVYQLRESVGSAGIVEVLYKTHNYCIAYSKGSYTGPYLPKPVEGETVLILQSVFEQDEDGEPYVVTQLDAFVKVNNFGVDMFAKLFAPMLGRIADNNFEQTIAFLGNVSEAAQVNPEVIKRLALRLESVRKDVREEFVQAAYQTAQLAINRSDNLGNHPYGRHLLERQTVQTDQQRQQFEQERILYLQNLHRIQQSQQKQQGNLPPSASGFHQNMLETGEAFSRSNTPPPRQLGVLVKPKNSESSAIANPKNSLTFEEMSPEDDFSRNLEIIEKTTPALMRPAPVKVASKPTTGTTALNLDLDLDFGTDVNLDKPMAASSVSIDEKSKNEQAPPLLDLNLEVPGSEGPKKVETANRNVTPKTTTKVAAVVPAQVPPSPSAPQKDPVANVQTQVSISSGKTGAVFGTPTLK